MLFRSYYSYTKHLMIPDYMLISTKALQGMSKEDREAFLALIPDIQDMADEGFVKFAKENQPDLGAAKSVQLRPKTNHR